MQNSIFYKFYISNVSYLSFLNIFIVIFYLLLLYCVSYNILTKTQFFQNIKKIIEPEKNSSIALTAKLRIFFNIMKLQIFFYRKCFVVCIMHTQCLFSKRQRIFEMLIDNIYTVADIGHDIRHEIIMRNIFKAIQKKRRYYKFCICLCFLCFMNKISEFLLLISSFIIRLEIRRNKGLTEY